MYITDLCIMCTVQQPVATPNPTTGLYKLHIYLKRTLQIQVVLAPSYS